ncbi:hypothetical protein [Coprothermobacter platensis]|uniref:hypothetical protein n=1 Tax=Coprothermobacter platensis TaxID=108819 RepID=UPI000378913B|nr:hypothetical protein [Coprothermobacter platensis]
MEKKKVLFIISSGDKQVILPALNLAMNSKKGGLYDDVKVHFFGISEKVAAEDEEIQQKIADLIKEGINPMACVNLSKKFDVSVKLDSMGFDQVPIGPEIAKLINDGYVPMVF